MLVGAITSSGRSAAPYLVLSAIDTIYEVNGTGHLFDTVGVCGSSQHFARLA